MFTFVNIYPIEHNFSAFETNIIRGICVILFTYWIAYRDHTDLYYVYRSSFWLLILRNICILTWVTMSVGSLYYLSLSVSNSINIFGSLSVFIWDSYIYGITINKNQKIGGVLGFLGAILIINSNYIYSLID